MIDERQRLVEQQVWAIIRASGGWNERTRTRLAYYAAAKKVEPWRIAAAVRRVAGGTRKPLVASATSVPVGPGATSKKIESNGVAIKSLSVAPETARGSAMHGIVIACIVFTAAVAVSGLLVWVALQQVERAKLVGAQANANSSSASTPGGGATNADASRNEPSASGRDASTESAPRSIAPSRAGWTSRTVPAAPAVFVKPPVLVGDLTTAWLRESLETLSSEEAGLERMAAVTTPPTEAEIASLLRVLDAFVECWPVLDPPRRLVVLNALVRSAARMSVEPRDSLRATLAAMEASAESTPRAWWRGAGAAGLTAALAGTGAGNANDEFALGAIGWLRPRAATVAQSAVTAAPGLAADLCESWLTAVDAAAATSGQSPALTARDSAVVVGLDALVRAGAPLDRSGTPADAAGSLLDALPWAGSSARRERIVHAIRAWLADSTVSSQALHGVTSVLASHRPGTWWDPWLVVDARASIGERAATGERFASALAAEPTASEATQPVLRGIDPELLRRWASAHKALQLKAAPETDPGRVARAAEWMALVESARLLERGRASDADARLTQLEDAEGLAPKADDRWRDGKPLSEMPKPMADGKLDVELRSRRSLEDRLNVLRSLRTRPIRDLGPLDAETLAHEAMGAPSEQVRSVAQGVIVDAFDKGPNVLSALLGEVNTAANGTEAAQLAAALAGVPAPRGNDALMRATAAFLLADQLAALSPSERNQLDAATRELGLSASAAAQVLGGDAVAGMRAERAMNAWTVARTADAQRTVPANVVIPMLARATARRHTAHGTPQLFAADQTLLLELDAAVLVERLPRRRGEIQAILQRAAATRAQATDIFAQIIGNARALAEIASMALGVEAPEVTP